MGPITAHMAQKTVLFVNLILVFQNDKHMRNPETKT